VSDNGVGPADAPGSGPVDGGTGPSSDAPGGIPPRPPIRLDGMREIRAPRERAWAILTDPAAVAACLPVPATAEIVATDRFVVVATVTVVMFPLRVIVDGRFVERVEPERAVLTGTAAVPGGSVSVEARVEFRAEADGTTTLAWGLEAVPTGLAAALAGQGVPPAVLEAVERTLACLVARIEA
jgi:carbon monoxide dehydrogenase subunit G